MSRLLFLDFDDDIDSDKFLTHVKMISSMASVKLDVKAIHRTARGVHVIVDSEWNDRKPMEPVEIVCLQILLGSDFKRESFNLLRAHSLGDAPAFWRDRWNVLYSEKIPQRE